MTRYPDGARQTRVAKRELLGMFGVDSGQVMIGDPCYLEWWEANAFNPHDNGEVPEYSYAGACRTSLNPTQGGVLDKHRAVVSQTGWGDGFYAVYRDLNEFGRVSALHILFEEEEPGRWPLTVLRRLRARRRWRALMAEIAAKRKQDDERGAR
jgi:Protein of unknown function (DUF4241)